MNHESSTLTDEQLAEASGVIYNRDLKELQYLVITVSEDPNKFDRALEIADQYFNGEKTLRQCIRELEALLETR